MSSNIKWDTWPHPKNGNLKALVCFAWLSGNPKQRWPAASKILCVIPLYDLRDLNYDGTYSWGEAALVNAPIVGGAFTPMGEAELMCLMGVTLKDGDFYQAGQMKALATAFKTADQAFRKNSLLPLLTGPAEAALAAYKVSTISAYIINKAWESTMEKLLGID